MMNQAAVPIIHDFYQRCINVTHKDTCLLRQLPLIPHCGCDQNGRSKKTSKLRATGFCEGNPTVTIGFPHKGPVTRKMFPFDDVIMILFKHGVWHICPCELRCKVPLLGVFPSTTFVVYTNQQRYSPKKILKSHIHATLVTIERDSD